MLALAVVVLLAGCTPSNPSETSARFVKFQALSEEISKREQQCRTDAVAHSNGRNAQVARPDAPAGQVAQQSNADEDHEVSQCEVAAQRDQAKLAASQRAEYADEAQQQRDRTSLMAILTVSQTH